MLRLFTPLTPPTTVWMTWGRIDGGGTSVGPFGLLFIDVISLQAVTTASAAKTLRILYRIVIYLLSGYGRTDMVTPMLRAVGSWPFSTPWRLLVSNAVSGSMVGCFANRSRLRPTMATVASEKPRKRATDGGSAYARRASLSLKNVASKMPGSCA